MGPLKGSQGLPGVHGPYCENHWPRILKRRGEWERSSTGFRNINWSLISGPYQNKYRWKKNLPWKAGFTGVSSSLAGGMGSRPGGTRQKMPAHKQYRAVSIDREHTLTAEAGARESVLKGKMERQEVSGGKTDTSGVAQGWGLPQLLVSDHCDKTATLQMPLWEDSLDGGIYNFIQGMIVHTWNNTYSGKMGFSQI